MQRVKFDLNRIPNDVDVSQYAMDDGQGNRIYFGKPEAESIYIVWEQNQRPVYMPFDASTAEWLVNTAIAFYGEEAP